MNLKKTYKFKEYSWRCFHKSTVGDMENLFNEYDKAIREKTDVAKDKVEEMKNRIENALK